VRVKLVDLQEGFDPSKLVTNPVPIDTKTKKFTEDGVFSEKIFGALETNNEWSCKCGELTGHFNSGLICKNCGTEVQYSKSSLSKKGWIDLGEYYIMNPLMYYHIKKIIKDIDKIIQFDPKISLNGKILEDDVKYYNIGLPKFYENFEEIINYYYENSNKQEEIEDIANFLVENYNYIFINKFPIFSPLLRPAHIEGNTIKLAEENTLYNQIIKNIELIKEKEGVEKIELSIYPLIYEIQKSANSIFDKTLEQLSGKTGFLRNTLLGNRINFSARTVISPLSKGLKLNQIKFPYIATVELYKYEIINILSKTEGYTRAHNLWYEATLKFSEKVYSVIEELIRNSDGGLPVLINRNPTIEFGSILFCRIKEVKKNISDLTLNISNNIIALLAADYDGDVITTISIKDKKYEEEFKKFDPRNLIISNDTGKFNTRFNFGKDYKMAIQTLLD